MVFVFIYRDGYGGIEIKCSWTKWDRDGGIECHILSGMDEGSECSYTEWDGDGGTQYSYAKWDGDGGIECLYSYWMAWKWKN